jgi:hypothetical protein
MSIFSGTLRHLVPDFAWRRPHSLAEANEVARYFGDFEQNTRNHKNKHNNDF